MVERPHVEPSREGVRIELFGDIIVPDRPKSWPVWRYRATYDADPVTVWVLKVYGPHQHRLVRMLRGPLSAQAFLRSLPAGARHLARWGHLPEGQPEFPEELVAFATSPAARAEDEERMQRRADLEERARQRYGSLRRR